MRRVRPAAFAVVAVLALASCASSSANTWTYAPASPATPAPSPVASASAGSSGSPATGPASAAPSAGASAGSSGGSGSTIELTAQGIAYDKASIQAPAGQPFVIKFHNADAGVPHNVDVKDSSGASVFKGEIFSGDDVRSYQVPALPAGNYTFVCDVHPNMTGTLVAGS